MNYSVKEKMPIIIIIMIIICLVMNHYIKKNAICSSVNEDLIKHYIVGTYAYVEDNDMYSGYLVCTNDNIVEINIINVDEYYSMISKSVDVDFEVVLNCNGKNIKTTGFIDLEYTNSSYTKWSYDRRKISSDIIVY